MKQFIVNRTKLRVKMVESDCSVKDICNILDLTYRGFELKSRGTNSFTENEIAILFTLFGADIFLPSLAVNLSAKKGGK